MERLLFLIDKLWKLLTPMLEADLHRIKVEILNVIIVGISYLLENPSALEIHFFVIFVQSSNTSRPYK
jgi:hypothetical protein